jgi:hypothetical protein
MKDYPMKLNDLDKPNAAIKALRENFEMNFDISSLDKAKTRQMLNKVRGLISESRRSTSFHNAQSNPAYLKLVFMEQALSQHMKVAKSPRIIIENEEVEKSQVILAAQDMIDTVQKMYEDINDMLVKELPALVDSIQSEIGVNESDQFNQAANQALTTLNSALQEAQTSLKGALGVVTGQGAAGAFDQAEPELDSDLGAEMGADAEAELNMEPEAPEADLDLPPLPDMEDEESPQAMVGRAKR